LTVSAKTSTPRYALPVHPTTAGSTERLFIGSDWSPDSDTIPRESKAGISYFLGRLQKQLKRRKVLTNLTPYQTKLLEGLRDSDDFIVIPNLGPAILERSVYTKRAFDDHLNDERTYRRLSAAEANARITRIEAEIRHFIENEDFAL
jgi:hypothetical protein